MAERFRAATRGQEFVLDLDLYPGVRDWVAGVIMAAPGSRAWRTPEFAAGSSRPFWLAIQPP
jgi:hypothetical protein